MCGAIGKGNAPEVNNMPMFTALHRRGRTQSLDVDLIPIVLAINEFSRVMNRCIMYSLYFNVLIGKIHRTIQYNTIQYNVLYFERVDIHD